MTTTPNGYESENKDNYGCVAERGDVMMELVNEGY